MRHPEPSWLPALPTSPLPSALNERFNICPASEVQHFHLPCMRSSTFALHEKFNICPAWEVQHLPCIRSSTFALDWQGTRFLLKFQPFLSPFSASKISVLSVTNCILCKEKLFTFEQLHLLLVRHIPTLDIEHQSSFPILIRVAKCFQF